MTLRLRWLYFRRGVSALWFWIPRVWGQSVWDWSYLVRIIEAWLERAEPYYRNHGMSVGSEKLADEMAYALKLCRWVRKNDNWQAMLDRPMCPEYRDWALRSSLNDRGGVVVLFRYLSRHLMGWWD